jgi:hypothetical protein
VNLHQLNFHAIRLTGHLPDRPYRLGFRVDALYGHDYRFTTMNGLFSNQLLVINQRYGYDMPMMMYGDIYIPWVA